MVFNEECFHIFDSECKFCQARITRQFFTVNLLLNIKNCKGRLWAYHIFNWSLNITLLDEKFKYMFITKIRIKFLGFLKNKMQKQIEQHETKVMRLWLEWMKNSNIKNRKEFFENGSMRRIFCVSVPPVTFLEYRIKRIPKTFLGSP